VSPKSKKIVNPETKNLPRLGYTRDELAISLRVSIRTINNLLREGALVRRKIGTATLIPVSSVEAFMRKDHATGEAGKRRGSAKGTRRGSR
jgi:hypothetical protein